MELFIVLLGLMALANVCLLCYIFALHNTVQSQREQVEFYKASCQSEVMRQKTL